jgi:hypothetical protein
MSTIRTVLTNAGTVLTLPLPALLAFVTAWGLFQLALHPSFMN